MINQVDGEYFDDGDDGDDGNDGEDQAVPLYPFLSAPFRSVPTPTPASSHSDQSYW